MDEIRTDKLKECLLGAAGLIIEREPELTRVDNIIGDGDHGTGMKRGFTAVKRMLENNDYDSVRAMMKAVSIELLRSMGGASGVIFGTMFSGGLKNLPDADKVDLRTLAAYFADGEKAVERRGRSAPGDKTMLDALYPAVKAMKDNAGETAEVFFRRAAEAAASGAEESSRLTPHRGRSVNFADKSSGIPDPGALSVSCIFEGMRDIFIKR